MADEETYRTRVFAAGRASFVLHCPTPELRNELASLFDDLETADGTADTVEVVMEESPVDGWSLRVDGEHRWTGLPLDWAVAHLITDVSRLALDAEPGRLHLHAAGLSHERRGILISAESGTGKTTLCAAMLQRGWDYMSDEMISLDATDEMARGFPKPLSLQPGGGSLVPAAFDARARVDTGGGDEEPWTHVRGGTIAASVVDSVRPAAVVLLHRAADGATDVQRPPVPVHPVDAVVALMGQTMDAERYGPAAVDVLATLAARCTCVALAVGPPDATAAELGSLVRAPVPSLGVSRLARQPGFDIDGWNVPEQVRSVVVGERAVVHDTSGGVIVALDEAGTAVWRALHDDAPSWWSLETFSASSTQSFLEALRSHRLLGRTAAEELSRR